MTTDPRREHYAYTTVGDLLAALNMLPTSWIVRLDDEEFCMSQLSVRPPTKLEGDAHVD